MIPNLELIRLYESAKGTIGVLKIQKNPFCVTLEPQDMLNRPNRSSIPAQQYTCVRYNSPSYGMTFLVENVPGRAGILFHPGNRVKDTEGCILLGQYFGKLLGDLAVLNSGNTFDRFMNVLVNCEYLHLTIGEVY